MVKVLLSELDGMIMFWAVVEISGLFYAGGWRCTGKYRLDESDGETVVF